MGEESKPPRPYAANGAIHFVLCPYSRHAAEIFSFSCVRLRFANRTYSFNTDGLYPNRHAAVGCNKRSAVHRDHMADFPPHPQPFSRKGRREQNHGGHMLQTVQFTAFFAPNSRPRLQTAGESPFLPLSRPRIHPSRHHFSVVTIPLGGFVTSDERHSSTPTYLFSSVRRQI